MALRLCTDREIRDCLLEIGKSKKLWVTTLEDEFLDSAVYGFGGEWNVEQRARAAQIAEKYRHRL